ncbi:MAG TPA: hypothetical protein VEL47_07355, partial [Myxococcota bacterium]|nr:hypothetical protein [Myxococcota bacterium]
MGIRQKIVLFLASYFIIFAGSSLIAITLDEILANPNSGQSQSESYLRTLGNNKSEIFDRIKNTLIAPPVINGQVKDKGNPSAYTRIDPAKFEDLIVKAILEEQSHPNDYYFYHSTQKAGIALAMLRTAIDQQINNWNRDDFLIIRDKRFFYPIRARTASDYFKQNIPYNTRFKDPETEALLKENSVGIDRQIFFIKAWDRKAQFDFISPYRDHLVSVSPAFIAGVDDTSNEKRNSYDMDWAAWESSFYYFATDLSWSNADRLYGFFLDDLKLQNPNLFSNKKEA